MWRELTMPSATHARTVADRCRKATFEAPGSLVRGTVRISTSKPAPFWGRQRRRAFQVTKSWSKAMTSKWKYRAFRKSYFREAALRGDGKVTARERKRAT